MLCTYTIYFYQFSSDEDEEEDGKAEDGACRGTSADLAGMSSDEDSDKCPICLNSFISQPVATPENCEHYFCLDCILEWAKVGLTYMLYLPRKSTSLESTLEGYPLTINTYAKAFVGEEAERLISFFPFFCYPLLRMQTHVL